LTFAASNRDWLLATFNPPQAPGTYTVVADCEKAGPQELSVTSGDMVQLIREGEEGQW